MYLNRRRKALVDALRIERQDAERAWPAVEALSKIVYTPEMLAHSEFHDVDWSHAELWVLGYVGDQLVVSAGIHRRQVHWDGQPVCMAGIGGVKTHPEYQENGYASSILEECQVAITEEIAPDFSMIFVETHNRPFYEKRGWRVFDGKVLVEQHGNQGLFPDRGTMVRDGTTAAPHSGVIDLKGKPW